MSIRTHLLYPSRLPATLPHVGAPNHNHPSELGGSAMLPGPRQPRIYACGLKRRLLDGFTTADSRWAMPEIVRLNTLRGRLVFTGAGFESHI
jgi:hypothetical protein